MRSGKIAESVLKRSIINLIDYKSEQVVSGAGIGQDCSVWDAGEKYVLSSTECALTGSRLESYFAVVKAANNIAACGGTPVSASAAFILPEDFEEKKLKELTRMVLAGCRECRIQLAGGHTEVTGNAARSMAAVTVTGFCDRKDYRSVKNIRPGMDIVATKWIGLEETALLLEESREKLLEHFPADYVAGAGDYVTHTQGCGAHLTVCDNSSSIMQEAAVAMKHGAVAMHDAAGGGIFAALWDLAEGAGTGITVDLKAIPVRQETVEFCEIFNINLYQAPSAGCLLIAAQNGAAMAGKLWEQGIHAAVIGYTTKSNDKIVLNSGEVRFLDKP